MKITREKHPSHGPMHVSEIFCSGTRKIAQENFHITAEFMGRNSPIPLDQDNPGKNTTEASCLVRNSHALDPGNKSGNQQSHGRGSEFTWTWINKITQDSPMHGSKNLLPLEPGNNSGKQHNHDPLDPAKKLRKNNTVICPHLLSVVGGLGSCGFENNSGSPQSHMQGSEFSCPWSQGIIPDKNNIPTVPCMARNSTAPGHWE